MNWQMISVIPKMLGAIGVIISLVYLAIQIRDQKKHSRNAVINSLTTQLNDFMLPQIENANLCALWVRGLRSFDEVDPASKLRFSSDIGQQLRTADCLHLQFLDGTFDPRLWRGIDRTIAELAAYAGFKKWWPTRKHWYSDELCALIDNHMQTAKPTMYNDSLTN
jgi:hypothetical protein